MREFRKPDLNAPRYRAQREEILNNDFYKLFRKTYSKYSHLSNKEIKDIVNKINGKIWETVIEERSGVELPEQLGYVFIGSCSPPKKNNPNFHISKSLDKIIQHRNWESDQYLAKIFYTNFALKYKFQFSNLWGFSPVRQFSRTVAKEYPKNYTKYVVVDEYKKINGVFNYKMQEIDLKEKTQEILNKGEYNEFNL